MMSQTRPSSLNPEAIREIATELRRQGGTVNIQNDGTSRLQQWINSTIGSIAILVAGWGVKSINDLNVTMSRVVTQNEYTQTRMNTLETRFENHINSTVRVPPDPRERQ